MPTKLITLQINLVKQIYVLSCFLSLILATACNPSSAQQPENWTKDQLIEPATLANRMESNTNLPVIISVGPGAVIPNSIDIGMVKEQENMKKFQDKVDALPKSSNIVIYCGCCPFDHCPNVRPAIAYLKGQGYTNYHLLNLLHNIKTDWISKGYPAVQ